MEALGTCSDVDGHDVEAGEGVSDEDHRHEVHVVGHGEGVLLADGDLCRAFLDARGPLQASVEQSQMGQVPALVGYLDHQVAVAFFWFQIFVSFI